MGHAFLFFFVNQIICLGCLKIPADDYSKVMGGFPITIDKAPYQVWIANRDEHLAKFGDGFYCGGSIISQRVVLSAAHCFYLIGSSPKSFKEASKQIVVAGCNSRVAPSQYTKEYEVEKIVPHEDYNDVKIINDIAIILLKGFIPWHSKSVQAIALAKRRPQEGDSCLISGWGIWDFSFESSLTLQQSEILIPDQNWCRLSYSSFLSGQICAGLAQGVAGNCQGDSGGPLVCSNRLCGIVSYGNGCGTLLTFGVYADVSYYKNWIRKVNLSFNHSQSFNSRKVAFLPILWFIALSIFLLWP